MNLFNLFRRKKSEDRGLFDSLSYHVVGSYAAKKSMLLSSVYRCTEVISDSVAQLPLEPYSIDNNGHKKRLFKHITYN